MAFTWLPIIDVDEAASMAKGNANKYIMRFSNGCQLCDVRVVSDFAMPKVPFILKTVIL